MRIKVLGCSGGKLPGHNIPGFLLNNDIVFDAGTLTGVLDMKAQLRIKNIFVTHAHLDHIRSIPFLADNITNSSEKAKHRVNIFSIYPVIKTIKKHLFNSAVWPDFTIIPRPEDAFLNLMEVKTGKSLLINSYTITPYKVNHTVPAVGFLVEDKKQKRFFYTGDTGPTFGTWGEIGDKQIHCLIIDVSFPDSMEDLAIQTGHLTPRLLKRELLKIKHLPEQICVTHRKPQFLKSIKADLERLKIKHIRMLNDGDIISV